ncbi:MAG TPA: HlyD family efflux transporter periplasmic adaptor subunit, partial [Steroidobacteraceae bacterium]|nr:HlyD family efflux transporter periplasmic adaptor subunit [Steroidobacteraceae bacterium]
MTALDTRAGAPRRAQVILLALSFLGTVLGCTRTPEEPEAEAAAIHVQVTSVRRGEIADVIHAMGQTEALTVLRLASPIAGRLTMLSVYPGDQLEQGAVAARVIPLENEAAAHGFAVLQRQGALSPAERETTRKLRNDIGARDIPLRTPFAAVVAERLRNPGEHVAPNDVLLELFDPHSLYVMAQVPLEAARGLQTGQPAELRAGAAVGAGTVAAVVSAVTPQTLTLPVRIALTAPLQPPLLHTA